METRLFRCTDCDREFRLQAWKAVCPSCGRHYTLVPVEEQVRSPSHVHAYAAAAALLSSGIYLLLTSPLNPVLALGPALAGAVLVLTRSRPGHIVAVLSSALLALLLGFPMALVPTASAVLAVYDEYRITRYKLVRQRLKESGQRFVEA